MDAYPYPLACSLATFSPHPCIGRYDDGEQQPQEGTTPANGLVTYSTFGNKPALFVGMTRYGRLLLPNRNVGGGGTCCIWSSGRSDPAPRLQSLHVLVEREVIL